MEKGLFLNMACVMFDVSSCILSRKNLNLKEYSGYNLDIGIPEGNGKFRLVKEEVVVREYLEKGKGIYMESKVYFLESVLDRSEEYKKFKTTLDKSNENTEKKCVTNADAFLLSLVAPHQISIINSIASLYDTGFFSTTKMIEKLNVYLEEAQLDDYLSYRQQDKKNQNVDQKVA